MATIQIKGKKCPVCKEWMRPVQKKDTGELGFYCTNCREFRVFDLPDQVTMAKETWGGARPGAGRKPADPDTKRVQMVISVSRHTRDILQEIHRDLGERPGRVIDRLIKDLEIE